MNLYINYQKNSVPNQKIWPHILQISAPGRKKNLHPNPISAASLRGLQLGRNLGLGSLQGVLLVLVEMVCQPPIMGICNQQNVRIY